MLRGWASGSTPSAPGERTATPPVAPTSASTAAGVAPRTSSDLDRHASVAVDQVSGGSVGGIIQRPYPVGLRAAGQSRQIEAGNPLGLDVHGELNVEGPRHERMVDAGGATAKAIAQRIRIVEGERFSHDTGKPSEEVLLAFWHLLHVVALAVRGLVTVDVPDADSVGGAGQRSGQSLEGAGADRRDDGRRLTVVPAERGRGVSHGHLVAALEGAHHALLLIDAQHLGERSAAVPENDQVLGDTLSEQPEHQPLRRGDVGDRGQGAGSESALDRSMGSNRASPRLRRRSAHGHLLLARFARAAKSGMYPSANLPLGEGPPSPRGRRVASGAGGLQ